MKPTEHESAKKDMPDGQNNAREAASLPFERVYAPADVGLTEEQVRLRQQAGAANTQPTGLTPTVGEILRKNIFTLFNGINLLLAVAVLLVGHPKNALFLGIALCNTAMGIFQELRAKRTLDKLSILAQGKATVVREGKQQELAQEDVVLDDILGLAPGAQVCADATLMEGEGLEVDEALLTGEADAIRKGPGQAVLSGSFVVAGRAKVRVTAVGEDNYATQITVAAKKEKKPQSQLMRTLNGIIRVLTIVIIPLGGFLFYMQYSGGAGIEASVLGASAAMLGMIPEGLILLTSVTLTVGALNLARRKALVQALPSIETLARADVLCLDKTGTITDGTLSFEELLPVGSNTEEEAKRALAELLAALPDENATAAALRGHFGKMQPVWQAGEKVPFSSARKWSGATFEEQGCRVMGAPSVLFAGGDPAFFEHVRAYTSKGYRVLALAKSACTFSEDSGLPEGMTCMALIVLSDNIREEAPETFRFFENEGVTLKVISGDDALTAATIAEKAGVAGAQHYVDMAEAGADADYAALCEEYTVFGRTSPQQKQGLIKAMEDNGHTTCMTGDGVNDVLAMKEASCSVAMINGSDAARGACDFVLMTSDFSAMVEVLREGRRVINNIENVASLYLVKTIYSVLLTLIYTFLPFPYPFAPLQMTPINTLTVGIPSFILALRANYEKPEGRFVANILENSVPAAVCVVFNILVLQLAGYWFRLSAAELSTMNVLVTGAVGFALLYCVSQPLTTWLKVMIGALGAAFLCCFLLFGSFFTLGSLFTRNVFFYLPLLYVSARLFRFLRKLVRIGEEKFYKWLQARSRNIPAAFRE